MRAELNSHGFSLASLGGASQQGEQALNQAREKGGEAMEQAPDLTLILADHGFVSVRNREPVTVKAGEVFVEPAHLAMTGRNLDAVEPATMVLFYASDPETPFADPVE